MKCPGKLFTLSKLLLLAILLCQPAGAQTISDTDKRINAHGDYGYWQAGQPDVMILWPQDRQNIVKRFSGNAQHPYPYRLWVDPGRAGGFPVVLKNASTFNNFLQHIKANADKNWCQLAETWSHWQGNPPSTCGTHRYGQRRTCTVAANATKPCPELCRPAVQTRTRSVDNGACAPPPPPPPPPPPSTPPPPPVKKCSTSAWTPSAASVCAGNSFTQTRTRADCSTERRAASGSQSCPRTCTVTAWTPGRDSACSRDSLTQTRTLSDCSTGRRTINGTRSCPSGCRVTAWTPAANTVCSGQSLTQTRTLSNCAGDSRGATGTKHCPPSCRASSWSPATSTVCRGTPFTQTRKLSDCSSASRSASGSKSCPRTCAASGWQPSASTVCSGSSFTQTRTLENCNTASRSASGAKCCGTATTWSPTPAGQCGSFTQSRTNACGKTETRAAKGTASWCGCTWSPYTPATGTVCTGRPFTQVSFYSCNGRNSQSQTRAATGTKRCQSSCPAGSGWGEWAMGVYCCRRYNSGGGILSSWSCVPGTSTLLHP